MLIELLVTTFLSIFTSILSTVTAFLNVSSIVYDGGLPAWIIDLVNSVFYFLPVAGLLPIFILWVFITFFSNIVAFFKFLWNLLPLT